MSLNFNATESECGNISGKLQELDSTYTAAMEKSRQQYDVLQTKYAQLKEHLDKGQAYLHSMNDTVTKLEEMYKKECGEISTSSIFWWYHV